MQTFESQDPNFEQRVRASFARQKIMELIGAKLNTVSPGEVAIELPFRKDLTQQHGFLHAGVITTIVDSACGYAALSLMPSDSGVLTIEYKVNFMSPAEGERIIAYGRVTKPGRTVTVCTGHIFAVNKGQEKLIAAMLATMIRVANTKYHHQRLELEKNYAEDYARHPVEPGEFDI